MREGEPLRPPRRDARPREALRPLDREAVARVIEQSSRLAGDGEKLTAHLQGLADLLREADQCSADASGRW